MRYFRTLPATYAVLQPMIDQADRDQPNPEDSYINNGKCDHILSPADQVLTALDGYVYMAISDWMFAINGSEQWPVFPGVEEITKEQYEAAEYPQSEL